MANTALLPIFPAPPRPPTQGWTPSYGNELTRWLENISQHFDDFTYGRFTGLLFLSFPPSAYGLRVGEAYLNGRVLTVVLTGDTGLSTVYATGSVGTITTTADGAASLTTVSATGSVGTISVTI
tara:strand:- start:141 stop:512 length:372 start_codon:yes stop_codon:yes gene_type:complete